MKKFKILLVSFFLLLLMPFPNIIAETITVKCYMDEEKFFSFLINKEKKEVLWLDQNNQKLIITIKTGVSNFQNEHKISNSNNSGSVTFITPEAGVFINLNKFINPKINKLKAWDIVEEGISIKNRVLFEKDYYDIYTKKILSRSQNFLEIEIIIKIS